MSWKLNGTAFNAPQTKEVVYNTQKAANRTISGSNGIDYIGLEKIYIHCEWDFLNAADWALLKGSYDDQRLHGTTKILTVDELSYSQAVIIGLLDNSYPLSNNYMYQSVKIDFIQI